VDYTGLRATWGTRHECRARGQYVQKEDITVMKNPNNKDDAGHALIKWNKLSDTNKYTHNSLTNQGYCKPVFDYLISYNHSHPKNM
jgi:hypothetical protein